MAEVATDRRVATALVAAALAATACRSGGSTPASPTTTVGSFRVVYEVQELDRTREEHIVVRRPYESRRTSGRDGATASGWLANDAGLWRWVEQPEPGWQLVDPGRRRAEADARPLGTLGPLVGEGLAELVGTARVLDRECQLVLTREPIGSPATAPPTELDHVELCVDEADVVLRETWVIDGRTVRERRAVDLQLDPALGDREFEAVPAAPGPPPAGRQLVEVGEAVLATLAVVLDPPADVTADGVVAWVTLDPSGGVTGGSLRRLYRRGPDLVDVEEVETDRLTDRPGAAFMTPLGPGALASDLHHLTLRIPIEGGITVILRASDLDVLTELTRVMRRREP
ncbi:MAG TPA: hypothetical protein VGA69_07995 [Nitriliruptorales bacterium]